MIESAAIFGRTLLLDAGPLVAAIDRSDEHHDWAKRMMPLLRGRVVSCEACICEAMHLLDNSTAAIASLRTIVSRIELLPVLVTDLNAVFDSVASFAPRMDLADGCLVVMQKRIPTSIVVTTDHRDFTTYRVPFFSPLGVFSA